jgi:septum formation protein
MRPLTPSQIETYIATGQWQGKAGAYGIQDSDPFVARIEGCLTNIVGLPMTTTAELLRKAGIYGR